MSLVFLDCETTGLDERIEDVFEVGLIRDDGEEMVFRIEPRVAVVRRMHLTAVEVNRYHERTADPAWRWHHPMKALHALYDELDGVHIVGAVPDFDARHLTSLYHRFVMEPPRWHYRLRCVESMVMGYCGQDVEGLSHAAELMGVAVPEGAGHTALGDARTVKAVYEAVMA